MLELTVVPQGNTQLDKCFAYLQVFPGDILGEKPFVVFIYASPSHAKRYVYPEDIHNIYLIKYFSRIHQLLPAVFVFNVPPWPLHFLPPPPQAIALSKIMLRFWWSGQILLTNLWILFVNVLGWCRVNTVRTKLLGIENFKIVLLDKYPRPKRICFSPKTARDCIGSPKPCVVD